MSFPVGFATAGGRDTYGSQHMTQHERTEQLLKMRSAKTPAEQEQIRSEHQQRMQERNKARGLTLPDEPPARGGAMGQGGRGMGPGGGPRR
ncbi:MAG: hypothetical protein SWC40_05970 [Thermodesulfobacteriota bacterium]|nr:hypothetical protein [Thermodesulfobacteriota bacterium]